MDKFIVDSTGTYDLRQVVAITPLTYQPTPGLPQVVKTARLVFASGRSANTKTEYSTAVAAWQAVVAPAAAASQA